MSDNQLNDLPVLSFKTPEEWEDWLDKHHDTSSGVWLRFYKKASGISGLTYAQSVQVALCYGWIDSLVKKYDEQSYIQKFTLRKSKSIWSKINTEHIKQLIKEGKMKPSGLAMVEEAKRNGNWDNAYAGQATITMPEDFQIALKKNKKAKDFYETLNKSNKYHFLFSIHTAKRPETRARRIQSAIEKLETHTKIY